MKRNKDDSQWKDKSYFAAGRRRRKRSLMIIIPVSIAVIGTIVGLLYSGSLPTVGNKMLLHNHVQLNVTSDGISMQVPAHIGMVQTGIGENPMLYGDHSLDQYGMEGMSPLHTHDASGQIHVESNTVRDYTLGELLEIWQGLGINGKQVQATVNGNSVSDFRNIILKDGDSISLNVS